MGDILLFVAPGQTAQHFVATNLFFIRIFISLESLEKKSTLYARLTYDVQLLNILICNLLIESTYERLAG